VCIAGAVALLSSRRSHAGERPTRARRPQAAARPRCASAASPRSRQRRARRAQASAENAYDAGPGNYLFEFKQPDGSSFFCQICDDHDDRTQCLSLGLNLSHRPAQGEQRQLPAELDRKCVYYLQKELGPTARCRSTSRWSSGSR
jgi:hypothetical protein